MFTLCFNFHRPLRISMVCNYFEHSCNTSTIFSFYVNLKEFCLSDNFFPSMLKIVSCLHWIASNKRSINQKCFGNNSKKKIQELLTHQKKTALINELQTSCWKHQAFFFSFHKHLLTVETEFSLQTYEHIFSCILFHWTWSIFLPKKRSRTNRIMFKDNIFCKILE